MDTHSAKRNGEIATIVLRDTAGVSQVVSNLEMSAQLQFRAVGASVLLGSFVFVSVHAQTHANFTVNQLRGHYIAHVAVAQQFRASPCGKQLTSFSIDSLKVAKARVTPFLTHQERMFLESGEPERLASATFRQVEERIGRSNLPLAERCAMLSGYVYGSFFAVKQILDEAERR